MHHAFARRRITDRRDIFHGVAQRDGVEIGGGGFGPCQRAEAVGRKGRLDRAQPVGPFRVAGGRPMFETGLMRNKERRHR